MGVPVVFRGLRLALGPAARRHRVIVVEVAPLRTVDGVKRALVVEQPSVGANVVTLKYHDSDPDLVRRVPT